MSYLLLLIFRIYYLLEAHFLAACLPHPFDPAFLPAVCRTKRDTCGGNDEVKIIRRNPFKYEPEADEYLYQQCVKHGSAVRG